MNDDICEAMVNSIKDTIREKIEEEFYNYKYKCLTELERLIELKRQDVVSSILNGIDVYISNKEPYSLDPVINIKVVTERKVVLDKGGN